MKGLIVRFVKKHRSLYNLAKMVNRRLNRISPKKLYSSDRKFYYTYTLKDMSELKPIVEHYTKLKNEDTKLLVIIDNPSIGCNITRLIRDYPSILFADLGYFKKYETTFGTNRIIFLDYHIDAPDVLNYIR